MNSHLICGRFVLFFSFLFVICSSYTYSQNITVQEYIDLYKDLAIEEMNKYGIPASITLAQGLLESGCGNSTLATEANNHFGIKCHKEWDGHTFYKDDDEKNECFRKYKDAKKSFEDHSVFLKTGSRYAFLFELETTDYIGWAYGLKKAGYATNPKYPELLIKYIEDNELYEYDRKKKPLPAEKKIIHKKDTSKIEDFEDVSVAHGSRKILEKNRIRCTYARHDDTFLKIAQDFEMQAWQIYKYNDLSKTDKIADGQLIYLQPKRRNGSEDYHIVKEGDTMYAISQLYGIKLKHLYRKNAITTGKKLSAGEKLCLRKCKGSR